MQKILLVCLLFSFGPVMAEGDAVRGEKIAYTCTGCHGIPKYKNSYPNYHVPKIGGQNAAYLETALKDYRTGARQHGTMQAQAGSLSDQDISDIAAYFSQLGQDKQDKQ
ncbi:MAG: cytochrome c [Proteobacteria bacterium]|nr:cytochrome c [Pseudomonadota bacterium]